MRFEEAFQEFIDFHKKKRVGRRLFRIQGGLDEGSMCFLKNVWWPAFGSFTNLHPEYEVSDFKDGRRYIDFVYLQLPARICIEIDGYGPHWQDMSMEKFSDDRTRQNHLEIDGWMVARFAYLDLKEKRRQCQQIAQQILGRWTGDYSLGPSLNHYEKEVVRMAIRNVGMVTLKETWAYFEASEKTARDLLRGLVDKGVLRPSGGTKRVNTYELIPDKINRFF